MNEMDKRQTKTQEKKPYAKPRLRRVELRPEEAVLGACKSVSGNVGGGVGGNCDTISCMSQGS